MTIDHAKLRELAEKKCKVWDDPGFPSQTVIALLDEIEKLSRFDWGKWNEQDAEAAVAENEALREKLKIAVGALEFYAAGQKNYHEEKKGDRREFGCGCCAGTIGSDVLCDEDKSVIGLTAREALAQIEGAK